MRDIKERFLAKVEKTSGCWLWTGAKVDGYGRFNSGTPDARKTSRAHRFSYELFVGPIPEGKMLCHTCDVRACVNPTHLFVGTDAENHQDALRKGRLGRKLTALQAKEIRSMYRPGKMGVRKLARIFGIDKANVQRIVRGKAWRYA